MCLTSGQLDLLDTVGRNNNQETFADSNALLAQSAPAPQLNLQSEDAHKRQVHAYDRIFLTANFEL